MGRDIDRVIALVRNRLPSVSVVQWHKKHPGDDDGIWWFRLPGVERDIQLESSFGTCPFLVEHDDMQSTAEQWRAQSVEQAAEAVIGYLEARLAHQAPDAEPGAAADIG
ncbi:MAG: hypothetical protein ACJ8C4_17570 [Gemmataceae bacterium]